MNYSQNENNKIIFWNNYQKENIQIEIYNIFLTFYIQPMPLTPTFLCPLSP